MAEYSLHIDVLVGTNLYFEYTSIHYVFSVVKRKRGKKKKVQFIISWGIKERDLEKLSVDSVDSVYTCICLPMYMRES